MKTNYPSEWKVKKIGETLNLLNGYAFKSKEAVSTSNTQLIRMSNLYQNKLDLKRKPIFYPDNFSEKYKNYLLKENDLIISLTGTSGKEDYGFTVKIDKEDRNLLLNQRVAKIELVSDEIHRDYILFFLLSRIFLNPLYLSAKGMKQANLSTNAIKKIDIIVPPLEEQKKIAAVLSLVQGAIGQQEKAIALTTELKKALMQKLFTEGTRNEPQKMTAIGLIPESWEVAKLKEVCVLQRGFDIRKKDQKEGSVPVVSSGGISSYHNEAKVKPPGVVVGRKGSVGRVHYIDVDYWPHDTTLWVKDFKGNHPKFISIILENLDLVRLDTGAANPTLNRNIAHLEEVAYPTDINVQKKIADIVLAFEKKVNFYQQKKEKLQELFQTLLHQLMTAQIRVDDLDLSALNLEP